MRILGIDPGYGTLGYGVIVTNGNISRALAYGAIVTPKTAKFPSRLKFIGEQIDMLIKKFNPDVIAVEELFFQNNQKTAIMVAEARGVILYISESSSAKLYEYTPLQIKQAMTGYGRATKLQVQEMVKRFLELDKIPKPDDAADALAVALTHAQTNPQLIATFGIK